MAGVVAVKVHWRRVEMTETLIDNALGTGNRTDGGVWTAYGDRGYGFRSGGQNDGLGQGYGHYGGGGLYIGDGVGVHGDGESLDE